MKEIKELPAVLEAFGFCIAAGKKKAKLSVGLQCWVNPLSGHVSGNVPGTPCQPGEVG